jgi:hypothetical protein
METYEIKESYIPRGEEKFLSQQFEDPHTRCDPYPVRAQKLTYRYAYSIAAEKGYKNIVDMGTGSGILLQRYFKEDKFNTVGYDLPDNVTWLKEKYPERVWRLSDFNVIPDEKFELAICADVVEHILEPNALIEWFVKVGINDLIISTPSRDNLNPKQNPLNGPPHNKYHIREWNFEEFEKYIGRFFAIENHYEKGIHQVIHGIKKDVNSSSKSFVKNIKPLF